MKWTIRQWFWSVAILGVLLTVFSRPIHILVSADNSTFWLDFYHGLLFDVYPILWLSYNDHLYPGVTKVNVNGFGYFLGMMIPIWTVYISVVYGIKYSLQRHFASKT